MAVTQALTRKELAEAMKVDRKTLNDWERKDSAPIAAALTLPLSEAVAMLDAWRKDNKRPRYWSEAEADEDGTLQERLIAAQIRKHSADAEAKELKNAVSRGELVPSDEVERQVAELTGLIRIRLESVARELEPELPAEVRAQVTELVANKVFLVLTEMSQWRLSE